jgi:hypothetical protein
LQESRAERMLAAMSAIETPQLLSQGEGVNDVWWPYVPGREAGRHSMPDPDEFVRLMPKYQCEFVGPPPALDGEEETT